MFSFMFFFIFSFIFEKRAVAFSAKNIENTPISCNNEALHIIVIVSNTRDYCERLEGMRAVRVVNAVKAQIFATTPTSNQCLLDALTFCSFLFCRQCSLVYIAENSM